MQMDFAVCEHLSRKARHELLAFLLDKLRLKAAVAARIGVSEVAVRKWLLCMTYPSNAHLKELLDIAFELDVKSTFEIIRRDLDEFSRAIDEWSKLFQISGD